MNCLTQRDEWQVSPWGPEFFVCYIRNGSFLEPRRRSARVARRRAASLRGGRPHPPCRGPGARPSAARASPRARSPASARSSASSSSRSSGGRWTPDRISTCGWTLIQKVREDRRTVDVNVVAATGVKREVLGIDVGTSEDGAFWLALLRSLTARGFSGVQLVTSDVHQGLKDAIATVFAGASWQRCRTHFMTNLLSKVPRRAQP